MAASIHRLKYSLFFGHRGKRVAGYDNERGKSDHRHLDDRELDYRFTSVEQLVTDFPADLQRVRGRGRCGLRRDPATIVL